MSQSAAAFRSRVTSASTALPAVSVSGSVPVANPLDSNANPIPLTTLSGEAAKSFVADQNCTFSATICTFAVFTVPAGKTALLESVTASCFFDSGSTLAHAQLFYLNHGSVIGGLAGPR